MNTWSQLIAEDVLETNFSPGSCAKSPLRPQASSQFMLVCPPMLYADTLGNGHIADGVGGLSRRLLNK